MYLAFNCRHPNGQSMGAAINLRSGSSKIHLHFNSHQFVASHCTDHTMANLSPSTISNRSLCTLPSIPHSSIGKVWQEASFNTADDAQFPHRIGRQRIVMSSRNDQPITNLLPISTFNGTISVSHMIVVSPMGKLLIFFAIPPLMHDRC
mmetsp:Transcript_42904/g.90097  ORF Transcript_42904/g.90097 Transcript_42904/m.90097 type:complete len:149 (-) Transcript_42904:1229-1675(-)